MRSPLLVRLLGYTLGLLALFLLVQYPLFAQPDPPPSPEDAATIAVLECCLESPAKTLKKARAGDMDAQWELGEAYALAGQGEIYPNPKAVHWLLMAADGGHAWAQNEMGLIYRLGLYGEDINYRKALQWLELAVAQGGETAHFNLARHYAWGLGVERDEARANHHYQIASEANYWPAILALSYRAGEGIGMAADPDLAAQLMARTNPNYGPRELLFDALRDYDDSLIESLLSVVEYRVRVNGSQWNEEAYIFGMALVNQEVLTEKEMLGIGAHNRQHLGRGNERTWSMLEIIFASGRLIKFSIESRKWTNPNVAFRLFGGAALMTNRDAQYELGVSYRDGRGTDVDPDEARYWFGRAAAQGQAKAREIIDNTG